VKTNPNGRGDRGGTSGHRLARIGLVGSLVPFALFGLLLRAAGAAQEVVICHRTSSESNPVEVIITDNQGLINGHQGHGDDTFFTDPDVVAAFKAMSEDEREEACLAGGPTTTTTAPGSEETTTTTAPNSEESTTTTTLPGQDSTTTTVPGQDSTTTTVPAGSEETTTTTVPGSDTTSTTVPTPPTTVATGGEPSQPGPGDDVQNAPHAEPARPVSGTPPFTG
jgi:hypothetical protein